MEKQTQEQLDEKLDKDVLSPILFSIYAKVMMIKALENVEVEEGIIGGQIISDVRFADD